MSDSVWSHRWQPTRLPSPWDSPGKNTGVGCHFILQCMKAKVKAQLCPTLRSPMDCSLSGSSVHGSFQARVLEWRAIAFSHKSASTSNYKFSWNKWNDRLFEQRNNLFLKMRILELENIIPKRNNSMFHKNIHHRILISRGSPLYFWIATFDWKKNLQGYVRCELDPPRVFWR